MVAAVGARTGEKEKCTFGQKENSKLHDLQKDFSLERKNCDPSRVRDGWVRTRACFLAKAATAHPQASQLRPPSHSFHRPRLPSACSGVRRAREMQENNNVLARIHSSASGLRSNRQA